MERASVGLERAQRRLGGPGLVGYLLVVLLAAAALAIYLLAASDLGARGFWFVVGEASGIVAAALLAITVILAGRVSALEWLFGDMTRVYVSHAVVGMVMFALVSVHPLLYVTGTLAADSGVNAAAHVIVPFHLVVLDWVSYILIATALVFTLYLRLPFAGWRFTHLLLGAAMLLTGYSILIDNRAFDTVQIPALRILLFALYGLATAAFLWVAVFSRLLSPKREYEITEAIHHPEVGAIELRGRPVGKPLRFAAGQFVGLDLLDDRLQVHRDYEAHPYSVITAPDRDEIGLVIEARGTMSTRAQEIAAADEAFALLHSPHDRLQIDRPSQRKQLWIGGGIGITPFLAVADELALHPDRYAEHEITLVAGVDRAEQAFYWDRLRECAERCPTLTVYLWDREERGLPSAERIATVLGHDPREHAVMLSGPDPMIADLEQQFRAAGVPRGQIRWERSIGPPEQWRAAAPALRRLRIVATATFATFAVLVVVSTVGRAVGWL